MMSEVGDRYIADERLPKNARGGHPCEFDRAYAELVAPTATHGRGLPRPCSELGTEERSFPVSSTQRPYFLCNGHLRDLFEALDSVRSAEH